MRLICIGDSLIEYFDWQQRLLDHEVWNLGRSGETVQELLWRVNSVIEKMEQPDRLLIMSGINNVAMEDYGFIFSYEEVLGRFKESWPDTVIGVNSLMPVQFPWIAPDTLPRLNERLAGIAQDYGAVFLDFYGEFLDEQGRVDEQCLLPDGVHISDEGYARWSRKIEDWLNS